MRIGIFSAKGGVGKTTISINLTASLLSFEKNVLLIDTDSNNSVAVSLGLLNFSFGLQNVLNYEVPLSSAIYITSSGLKVLPAGNLNSFNNFALLMNEIENFDFIIVDTEPGISEKNLEIARVCKENFLVTLPETTSIYALMRTVENFEKEKIKISGIIVNRYSKYSIKPEEIYDLFGIPILTVLPEEKGILKSLNFGIPYVYLNPYSDFSIEIKSLAAKIANIKYSKPSFLKKLLRWF